ncbi:RNA polymerase sigma-70 factor [Massilibacteroides sp.]|uniref:RNA polymerase sigma-70 factor n=1 Tax=Massilibacteroides sp. TaxID=2034766 RepID=UPI00262A7E02|nr:RNA polymerase sigma-70 factor [Massilibacteroides sp.]MDD4515531.1 RNA polymerase sigma-70 factor [Massilibacteroides sp.]
MCGISSEEFERNFKSLYKPLCLFSLRITTNPDDAEDIVQQAFSDAWTKCKEGETIDNFKAYMYRTVRNRSLSYLSQTHLIQTAEEFPETEDLSEEEQIYEAERNARLWEAIDKLPPARRDIFLMAKRDGMKYQEIADSLQLSIKTIENQMGKALKTLRETATRIYTFFFCPA